MHFLEALNLKRAASEMLFKLIKQFSSNFEVEKLCTTLSVSRSGYYRWLKNPFSNKKEIQEKVLQQIKDVYEQSKGVFGSPRITAVLRNKGYDYNRKRIAKIMKDNNIRSKMKSKFKITTNSKHKYPICENLLQRNFSPSSENQIWCSDITYVRTDEGWLFLAVVIDLFSRKVVGWAMSKRMKTELVAKAFKMAWQHRGQPKGLIFHSDRGSQYASNKFKKLLKNCKVRQSMSRAGDCWDNACAESFFASLKKEEIYQKRYLSRIEAKRCIFEYIELFYNSFRPHSYCGGLSPNQLESKISYRKSA